MSLIRDRKSDLMTRRFEAANEGIGETPDLSIMVRIYVANSSGQVQLKRVVASQESQKLPERKRGAILVCFPERLSVEGISDLFTFLLILRSVHHMPDSRRSDFSLLCLFLTCYETSQYYESTV